jgi:hypothetical protein
MTKPKGDQMYFETGNLTVRKLYKYTQHLLLPFVKEGKTRARIYVEHYRLRTSGWFHWWE